MKKLLKLYRRWRYRRLLRKLFWFYAERTDSALEAMGQAVDAFIWFTGEKAENSNWINYWWYL